MVTVVSRGPRKPISAKINHCSFPLTADQRFMHFTLSLGSSQSSCNLFWTPANAQSPSPARSPGSPKIIYIFMLSNIIVAKGKSLLFPPHLSLCFSPPCQWGLGLTAADFAVSLPAMGCQAFHNDAAVFPLFPPFPLAAPLIQCHRADDFAWSRDVTRLWTFAGGWLATVRLKL